MPLDSPHPDLVYCCDEIYGTHPIELVVKGKSGYSTRASVGDEFVLVCTCMLLVQLALKRSCSWLPVSCNSDETQPHFLLLSPRMGGCLYR
jgi:hypothetical protein